MSNFASQFAEINARVVIGFALTMIVLLLTYIAFFKDSSKKNSYHKRK